MMLLSNYAYEYNNFLEHAIRQPMTPFALGCVVLRFYFLWRHNPSIAGSIRAWCLQSLPHPELQACLLSLTEGAAPTTPPSSWRQWMVAPDTIEDHIVPATRGSSFVECLMRAEWIDVNYVFFNQGFTFDAFESTEFAVNLIRGYYISTL
jgi:hypothetical protein